MHACSPLHAPAHTTDAAEIRAVNDPDRTARLVARLGASRTHGTARKPLPRTCTIGGSNVCKVPSRKRLASAIRRSCERLDNLRKQTGFKNI